MQYTRILCLGDSITFGARARWGRTYPVLLEQKLAENRVPSVCINAGVNGETSWQIVERGQRHLLDDPWIRVVVCLMGTNDSKPASRTPIDIYMASWKRLLLHCRCTDTWLFPVEIPAIDATGQPEYDALSLPTIEQYNDEIRDWCVSEGLTFIDGIHSMFAENIHDLLADGIHPNNEGDELIADRVHAVLGQPLPYIEPADVTVRVGDVSLSGPSDVVAAGFADTSNRHTS